MKKRRAWIVFGAITLLVMVLLIMAAVRDPTDRPDFTIVNGVEPFTAFIVPDGALPQAKLVRTYSLHMSYDEAVQRFAKEHPNWKMNSRYEVCSFLSPTPQREYIEIERGRTIDIGVPDGSNPSPKFKFPSPMPDPKGWVTIRTHVKVTKLTEHLNKLRLLVLPKPRSDLAPYMTIIPLPRKGGTDQVVDAWKGSADLEGTGTINKLYSSSEH